MEKRVYYHDTDCGGVVYYGNYLKYIEEARTECLENKGVIIAELMKQGLWFVVARQEMDYKSPAVYGDILMITANITAVAGVRVEFDSQITRQDGKLIAKGKTVMVSVNDKLKPTQIPEEVKMKLL